MKTALPNQAKPFFFRSSRALHASRRLGLCARTVALFALASLIGCGHESKAPVTPGSPAAAVSSSPDGTKPAASAEPEMAPTPYTADQLRDANRPGTLYRYKVETKGEPVHLKVLEFTAGTSAEGAEVKDEILDEAGHANRPAMVEHASWDNLRRHAEFPRDALKVEPGSIEVPAGKFDAMVYTVNLPSGETMSLYFAKSYAGPPVLFYKEQGGVRLMTTTLIERRAGK